MILREIVTKLGFTIDEKKIKQFENSISQIKDNITSLAPVANMAKKAIYGITGAATSMTLLSLHTAKSIKETEILAKKFGMTSEQMQGLELVAQSTGTSIEELSKSMNSLDGTAIKNQRDELLKLAYVVNSKGVESSKKFLKSWSEFRVIIGSIKKELSIQFMPVFTSMTNKFKDWYLDNKKLISQNISSFIKILTIAFEGLFSAIQLIATPINAIINLFGGFENAISVLGIALGVTLIPRILSTAAAIRALTIAMLANPVTWLTAALAALGVAAGLVLNDLWHWAHGNESVIGYVLKEWLGFEGSFNDIMDNISQKLDSLYKKMNDKLTASFSSTIRIDPGKKFKERLGEIEGSKPNKMDGRSGMPVLEDINNLSAEDRQRLNREDQLDIAAPILVERAAPLLDPFSTASGIVPNNTYNSGTKVSQYITENITITVPAGTSSEQARAISQQVTSEMQSQFDAMTWQRGIDSLSSR